MKKNKTWLSLVIAIGIALVMSLLALYILEYIIPFWKNTKNIEQSVAAYYLADSWIEDWLYQMKLNSWTLDYENNDNILTWSVDYSIIMIASWSSLPRAWEWNSGFDKNFNIIKNWEPIQIEIWNGRITDLDDFKIYFKIPNIDKTKDETLSWGTVNKIINWQLSWENDVLNANWSQVNVFEINNNSNNNNNNNNDIVIGGRFWLKLDDSWSTFKNFYNDVNTWYCTNKSCKLKMSVINKLEWKIGWSSWNDTRFPYLEWRIDAWSSIPLRYRIIDTTWKSYWFQKSLRIKVPQQTLNEAFDFTVFQ